MIMKPEELTAKITETIQRGIIKASTDMESHAVRWCPVDTGRLRASIKIKTDGNQIILGAYTDYAEYVEFGTPRMIAAHGEHDPEHPVRDWEALRKRGGTQQQMPFIRPALHKGVRQFIPKRVLEELRKLR